MKTIKQILGVMGVVALLAGCASQDNGRGGMGNATETSSGEGNTPPEQVGPPPSGPNGSISRSNPFGQTAGESQPVPQ